MSQKRAVKPRRKRGVQIVPVRRGSRVDFDGNTGRVFPRIRNLNIVKGKPLYAAGLPEGETDFWHQELVVYGLDEYVGPEVVTDVFGIVNGQPIYMGWTTEDGNWWIDVYHGHQRGPASFDDVVGPRGDGSRIETISGRLVYAASVREFRQSPLEWFAVIGSTKYGPYDDRPTIEVTDYATPMYDNDGHLVATGFEITGRRKGRKRKRVIDISRVKSPWDKETR